MNIKQYLLTAFDEDDTVHTTGETMDLSSSKTLEVTSADKTDEVMKKVR